MVKDYNINNIKREQTQRSAKTIASKTLQSTSNNLHPPRREATKRCSDVKAICIEITLQTEREREQADNEKRGQNRANKQYRT